MTDEATEELTSIRVDQFFPHPPELVWRVLTTSELMARWLMPNDFRPEVGHTFHFHAKPIPAANFSGTGRSTVLAVEPLKLLRISWGDADPANTSETVVTWRLEAEGRGTRMFLEHTGFDPDDAIQQTMRKMMNGGWRGSVLSGFARIVEETAAASTARGQVIG
ncbi:MAG TPA: SRPBCC domain-containing protein [Pseudonocardiaceae bacterium]|jgi:uncharacterized protein YndB with AHSA1/START domain|nr:SRPBCC domain-containing protein [Pseudonocardiaceae bacterium]